MKIGFLIKSLNPEILNPKDNQCDVFGRFTLVISGKECSSINYELVNIDEFCDAFKKSMNEKSSLYLSTG